MRDQDAHREERPDAVREPADGDREWDRLFKRRPDVLAKLAEEAREERRRGETQPLDPDEL